MKSRLHKLYCKLKIFGSKCLSALEKPLRFLFIFSYVFFVFHYFVGDVDKHTANAQGDTLEVYLSFVLPPVNAIDNALTSPTDVDGSIPNSYLLLDDGLVPTTFITYTYSDIIVAETSQRSFTNVAYSIYYDDENLRYYVLAPAGENISSLYFSVDGSPSVIEYQYIYITGSVSAGLISDYCKTTVTGARTGSTIKQQYYRDDAIQFTVEYKTTNDYVLMSKTYYSEPFLLVGDSPSIDKNGYNLGYYKGYYAGYDDAIAGTIDTRSPVARIVDGVNSFMRLEIIPNVSVSFLLICAFGFVVLRLMLSVR